MKGRARCADDTRVRRTTCTLKEFQSWRFLGSMGFDADLDNCVDKSAGLIQLGVYYQGLCEAFFTNAKGLNSSVAYGIWLCNGYSGEDCMIKREVYYFEDFGEQNTRQTIEAARKAALNMGLKHVVVATASGKSGVEAAKAFKDTGMKVVVVTEYAGMAEFTEANRKKLEEMKVQIVTSAHSFLSPAESISQLHPGYCSENTLIKEVLRRFSQGMKVAAEIVMMATDAGAIPPGVDVVSVAGTGSGADTAVVVKSCHSNDFFHKEKGMEFREIVAMPRMKKFW